MSSLVLFACLWIALFSAGTDSTSFRKCCALGQIFNESTGGCGKSNKTFQLPEIKNGNGTVIANSSVTIVYASMLACNSVAYLYYLDPLEDPSEEFVLLDTGWLMRGDGKADPPNTFCLDMIESMETVLPFFCFPGDEDLQDPEGNGTFAVYPKFMFISVPFLLATFIVYASIKQLRTLHGKTLMSHVAALSLSYVFLCIVQVASGEIDQLTCTCLEKYSLFDNESWRVSASGLRVWSGQEAYNVSDYCVDEVQGFPTNGAVGVRAFLCFQVERSYEADFLIHYDRRHYLFAACYFLSSLFILASLAAFVIVKLRNFEKLTICFLFPLFVGQLNYGITLSVRVPHDVCIFEGVFGVKIFTSMHHASKIDIDLMEAVGVDEVQDGNWKNLLKGTYLHTAIIVQFTGFKLTQRGITMDMNVTCPDKILYKPHDPSWVVTDDGLKISDLRGKTHFNDKYCIEDFFDRTNRGVYAVACQILDVDERLDGGSSLTAQVIERELYPVLLFISAVMVLLTLIIYVLLICPHSRASVPQKTYNINYMVAFFISASLLAVSNAGLIEVREEGDVPPIICGFAVQFFFLATFFWLNVMCIDIYWAFSDLRSLGGSAASWRDQKKLLFYSLYAWGMPLLILFVTIAVDYAPSIPTTSKFKPAMGLDKCFFRGRTAGWVYFYGPMAIILLTNCLLFGITAYHLYRHRRDAGFCKRGDSRRHGGGNDKERFNLYFKLFIVMGVNWLSEVISFTFNKDVPDYLWYLTDITNTLQGVFIFLIFVWKQRVRQLIWDKLCKRTRTGSSANNTSSTSITTNSTRSHHNSIKMSNINNVASVPINSGSDHDDEEV